MRNCLLPSDAAQHRAIALPKGRLVDIEFVGIDLALDDVFAQPVGAGDENHVAKARFGVESEDHAAGGEIGADHLHHADRQRDLEMVEAVIDPVDDGPIGEDRGKARRQASNKASRREY